MRTEFGIHQRLESCEAFFVQVFLRFDISRAYSHNFIELISNSTACDQFVVLMKKSNQFGEIVVGNLEIKASDNDYKLCCFDKKLSNQHFFK